MTRSISRREFMALNAGAMAVLMSSPSYGDNKIETRATVPRRAFGKSGVTISKLCFGGGSFGGADSQALLDEALKYGVDCWEIVSFTGKAYSEYFRNHPGARERVFLSGKVYSPNPAVMDEQLEKTLIDNGTSCIDFLAVHAVDDTTVLTDEVRKWAEKAKKEKKIRFFGFCTHKNMDKCLAAGADLGWIDGIQTVYNYRFRGIRSMEEGLRKCHEKGIGIFTVKSMGLSVQPEAELKKLPLNKEKLDSLLTGHAMSFAQAKLKAIWQNPHVTSICSLMPASSILQSNVAAAMDERPLDGEVNKLLADYGDATGRFYCRRCGLCLPTNADKVPIFNIMELLMYSRRYDKKGMAADMFARIPAGIRAKIIDSDYSRAEGICPQKMPIARFMKEAYRELGK